ncbi:hypothetical protein DH2020_036623 [Rehmannia glutinosa]|uniref:NmrA-like domain-containing protein n=1 Tax=Rehmannia glutinosa TaxID=99300 RepID=A0ABR0V424_REHGL
MEKDESKSKILIFGGTGYIGSYMVKASIKLGHPTYVFSRPNSNKIEIINELQSMGAIIVKGKIDEHEKLVSVRREVDVVISALPYPQVLDQLKILEAIKVAGNIKSECITPFQAFLEKKKKIRRAIEAANIPYTFVSANCFAAYFVNYLLRPFEQNEEITVYGTGEAKAVLNYEDDIGIFTIKVAIDPRTCNRVVIYRQQPTLYHRMTLPDPQNIPVSILHSVFVKGVTTNFDIAENEVEASALYPDLNSTTIDELRHFPARSAKAGLCSVRINFQKSRL